MPDAAFGFWTFAPDSLSTADAVRHRCPSGRMMRRTEAAFMGDSVTENDVKQFVLVSRTKKRFSSKKRKNKKALK
jgi:hypothetical protein